MNDATYKVPDFSQRDLVDAYYDSLKEAVNFVQMKVIPVLNGQINLNYRETAVLGIFYRMHVLASSQTRLNDQLDFSAVAIVARTLYELLLDLKLLSSKDSTDGDLERFRAFPAVERFRAAMKISEHQKRNPDVIQFAMFEDEIETNCLANPSRQASVEEQVRRLWGTNKKGQLHWPHHWSGKTVKQRADHFGAVYVQEYLELYGILSWHVHAGSVSYAGLSPKTLEGIYGIAQNVSRKMYIEGLIICAKTFSLFKGISDFPQVIEFLKDAPKQLLIELALGKLQPLVPK